MKRFLPYIAGIVILFSGIGVSIYVASKTPATSLGASTFITQQGGTGTSSPSGILYGDNGATSHINTVVVGSGLTFTGGTLSNTQIPSPATSTNPLMAAYIVATSTTATSTLSNGLSITNGGLKINALAGCFSSSALITDSSGNVSCGAIAGSSSFSTTSALWWIQSIKDPFTASYFTATSTTATSTFAGGLAVETSGLVYDFSTNFLGLGTSSPKSNLVIDTNTPNTDGTLIIDAPLTQKSILQFNSAGTNRIQIYRQNTTNDLVWNTAAAGTALIFYQSTGVVNFGNGFLSALTGSGSSTLSMVQLRGALSASTTIAVNGLSTLYGGFVATASSSATSLLSTGNILARGALEASGTLSVDGLTILQGGFISNASSSATSFLTTGNLLSRGTLNASGTASVDGLTILAGGFIATASSSANQLFTHGSTTIFNSNVGFTIASTTDSATQLVNFTSGRFPRYVLSQNTTYVFNSTSSNPVDGLPFAPIFCQGAAGGKTGTIIGMNMRWPTGSDGGTTTINTTANTCTIFGGVYDNLYGVYRIYGSSTVPLF